MSTYLLEIGTEELPSKFAYSVVKQFKSLIELEFEKDSIEYENIFCSSTPRRIVLFISGLVDKGKDKVELKKGPKAEFAFNDGKPTNAAKGFARSLNIHINDLKIRKTDKGEFVFGEKIEKGKLTSNLLSQIVPKVIKSVQGQRFMKWGYSNFKFSRPIRWILSIYNREVLNLDFESLDIKLETGNTTRGHRLFAENIAISNSDEYFNLLRKSGVIVDRDIRKREINDLVTQVSKEMDLYPDLPNDLLNELTDLVENPELIVCNFDPKFLILPSEVLCTVMRNHQRYIPLFNSDKDIDKLELDSLNVLSTRFLCISNGLKESNSIIQNGNENVIKARFSDAKFFVETDKKLTCIERNQKLKDITYLKGLGSIFEKVKRIEYVSMTIHNDLKDKTLDVDLLQEASRFSKNDLCSEMVFEFPELQGIMGGKYLKNEGYKDDVCLAVSEHYYPRFYKDNLPSTKYGAITSISDKLETIVSIFVIGKRPSGSSDPYALRRNLNGIIQIIWEFEFNFEIDKLIRNLLNAWKEDFKEYSFDYENIFYEIIEFLKQRLFSHLEELAYDKEIIDSVCNFELIETKRIFNIQNLKKRITYIEEIKKRSNSQELISIISRYCKLAKKGSLDIKIYSTKNFIDKNLFEKDSEYMVFELVRQLENLVLSKNYQYEELINLFEINLDGLFNLFDNRNGVLIMAEDIEIRNNRLNLIGFVRNYSLLLADFTLLSS